MKSSIRKSIRVSANKIVNIFTLFIVNGTVSFGDAMTNIN